MYGDLRDYFGEAAKQETLSFCRPTIAQLDEVMNDRIDRSHSNIPRKPIVCFEFSITFTNKRRLYDKLQDYVYETIKKLNDDVRYILYPELGTNLNLHYHGIIWGDTLTHMAKLKAQLNLYFGRTYIRPIKYRESYKNYVIKEREQFNPEELHNLTIFRI